MPGHKSPVLPVKIAFGMHLAGGSTPGVNGKGVQSTGEFIGQKRVDAPVTFNPA